MGKKERQMAAIKRLETQLLTKKKKLKDGTIADLTDTDIKRIQLEIETLKKRIL
ncbi:MAG: hypothetical protein J5I47_08925 [Vicingus serpentipes]|nr:hypothetical protein [Vicingus serpentipes]